MMAKVYSKNSLKKTFVKNALGAPAKKIIDQDRVALKERKQMMIEEEKQ